MTTNNDSEIVFDPKSGISEEEQREILAKINNIAEKNRLSLSEGKKPRFKAKKSGSRFPVIVNVIAIAALAVGLIILISMQGRTDTQIRTGSRVYNSAERAIIEEIKRETQYGADGEMERLNRDQAQGAAVEAQMSGFFFNLNKQITDNNFDEAGSIIIAMREFINTPGFESLRSMQARKNMYIQAIDSFETLIDQARSGAAPNSGTGSRNTAGLQAMITQLEQDLAEKDKTIQAFSSQGDSRQRRLSELEKTNTALQNENRRLTGTNTTLQTQNTQLKSDLDKQTAAAARDLQAEKAETARLNGIVTARDNTIARNEAALANRNDVINKIRAEVELDREYDDIPPAEIKTRIARIQSALRNLN